MESTLYSTSWSGPIVPVSAINTTPETSSRISRRSSNSNYPTNTALSEIWVDDAHRSRISGRYSALSRDSWRNGLTRVSLTSASPDDMVNQLPDQIALPTEYSEKSTAAETSEKSSNAGSMEEYAMDPGPRQYEIERMRTVAIIGLLTVSLAAFAIFSIGVHLIFVQQAPSPPSFLKGMTARIGLLEQDWYDDNASYNLGHWACSMSKGSVVATPLLLNLFLTAAFSVMSYIDSTVLRWALWRESNDDRSVFVSHPRLFTPLRRHAPLSWYANLLSGTSLVLAFGATAVLTTEIEVIGVTAASRLPLDAKPFDGPHHGLDFSGWALLVIGASFFVQLMITSWNVLWNPTLVKTWSNNPFSVGRAAFMFPRTEQTPRTQRRWCFTRRFCFALMFKKQKEDQRSSSLSSETTLALPERRNHQHLGARNVNGSPTSQSSLHTAFKSVRQLKLCLWLLVALSIAAVITVSIVAALRDSNSGQFVYNAGLSRDSASYWQWYGYAYFPYVVNYYGGILDPVYDQRDWLGILIQSGFQAPVTLALHCTSIILDLNRDEATWQRVATKTGVRFDMNPFLDAALNWPAWVFFLYKGVLQWIFGYAVFSSQWVVSVSLIPLITLTAMLLPLGIIAEVMTSGWWTRKNTLPTTYGNIGLLAELIRDLEGKYLYWDTEKQELTAGPKKVETGC